MSEIEILVPVATTRVETRPLAPRLDGLHGARIGWLDNRKANAGALLSDVAACLRGAGHAFEDVCLTKIATEAAPEDVMAHLRTCDAVVLAIAALIFRRRDFL